MFKGKIYLSRKEGDKEEKIEKEFDNKKDFDAFVDKNPDLKKLRDFKWEPISWSEPLLGIRKFFEDAERDKRKDVLSKMEQDIRELFDKTKKLLGK